MARSLFLSLNKSISTVHLHPRHKRHLFPLSPYSRHISLRSIQPNRPLRHFHFFRLHHRPFALDFIIDAMFCFN
ncbi:hypothetical protein Patl1_30289 [Pistacia atlantica]|uniref:Uncharacterized protein n=1 Tax=Pistacia atlantica TaxID=434234 RepID=A0ACC1A951_9ROSI|nr:hypothetical protein Patl1_30289 [Pistacia atlantica]